MQRHSAGRRCQLRMESGEALLITVADDGKPSGDWSPGVGLRSIADRAEEVGGSADAGPSETGWRVVARLPQLTG